MVAASLVSRPAVAPERMTVTAPAAVSWWAGIGALFVGVNAIVYIGWATHGSFRSTPTGPDPVPTSAKVGVWVFQISSILLAVAAITYVVRQCLRAQRLTFDAALLIAWVLASWQDPLLNYLRPAFLYNSYFTNVGGWAPSIPGWISPHAGNLPEDIIGTAGIGYVWFVLVTALVCGVLRRAKQRWPALGLLRLWGIALLLAGAFDFAVEVYCVHIHLWAYPGAVHKLSLFGGSVEQFPTYETLLWGSVWATLAMVRLTVDDRGLSIVERGASRIPGSRRQTFARVLAVTGMLNVVFLLYSVVMIWTTTLGDTATPKNIPSYLRDNLCGAGTPFDCPAPGLPLSVRGQAP